MVTWNLRKFNGSLLEYDVYELLDGRPKETHKVGRNGRERKRGITRKEEEKKEGRGWKGGKENSLVFVR